jgi:hypothetical protein
MIGGFPKSGNFTGRVFSGGSTKVGLPVLGFADEADGVIVSGAYAGLGLCEGVLDDSLFSVDETAGVGDDDWAGDTGEKKKITVAASASDLIMLESSVTSSQNRSSVPRSEQRPKSEAAVPLMRFTVIRTVPGALVLTRPR